MFYQSISDVYDYIFPTNRKQLEFIEVIQKISHEEYILDIGCATGNLSRLLAKKSDFVTGIDLDENLLHKAKNKESKKNIVYKQLNMLSLTDEFENESIDRVISFGNTLVHLPDRSSVDEYFQKVHGILKEKGLFITQIINYDRIINKNILSLDTIDNQHIRFVRNYIYHKKSGIVDFVTELKLKNDNTVIKNNIPLLALTKDELFRKLTNAGFQDIKFYGNLNGGSLLENSIPLIFSCTKN